VHDAPAPSEVPQLFVCANGAGVEIPVMLIDVAWLLVIVTTDAALVELIGWFGKGISFGV